MEERILTLAQSISDADASEMDLLEMFCKAQAQGLQGKLKQDVLPENCGEAFLCAVALLAAADLYLARGGGNPVSFTVGEISVRGADSQERQEDAAGMKRLAAELMNPYLASQDLYFCGVQG